MSSPSESSDRYACAGCGYDLRGLGPEGICPECQTRFYLGGDDCDRYLCVRIAERGSLILMLGIGGLGTAMLVAVGLTVFNLAIMAGLLVCLFAVLGLIYLIGSWWPHPYDRIRSVTLDSSSKQLIVEYRFKGLPGPSEPRIDRIPFDDVLSVHIGHGAGSNAGHLLKTKRGSFKIGAVQNSDYEFHHRLLEIATAQPPLSSARIAIGALVLVLIGGLGFFLWLLIALW